MRHLPLRPAVVLFFSLCVWTAVTARSHGQQAPAAPLAFPASAWRAIAHGKPSDAENLAQTRPADDPAAVAVLGNLAVRKGRYNDAITMLQPAANRAGCNNSDPNCSNCGKHSQPAPA